MKSKLVLVSAASAFAGLVSLSAATVLNSGATFDPTPTNWSNGSPGAGNDGTINANYTLGGNIAVGAYTVTQTAGTGAGGQFNYYNSSAFVFNLQGGAINSTSGTFFINQGVTNMSGGTLSAVSAFQIANGGRFNVSGGTLSTTATTLFGSNTTGTANVLSLTGGTVSGASATSLFGLSNLGATIGGGATINASGVISFFNADTLTTASTLNFVSGWTGSLNLGSSTNWSNTLISSGATFNGVDIDGSNIGQFTVTGGQIKLAAVPEPSAYGMLGAGAITAAAIARRLKRKVA